MKTYFLLRNNQESGPYSLEQVRKQNLKKHDLVWIDNQSITWKYPSEIQELRQFAPKAELSFASLVNERKEKQILYFQLNYQELNYKKLYIESIPMPDAYLSDIERGFEYMVNLISINQREYAENIHINENANVLIPQEFEYILETEPTLELSNDNFEEDEPIDVPEVLADPEFFESPGTFTWKYQKGRTRSRWITRIAFLEMMIIGICLASFLAIGYLIESGNYNSGISARKAQLGYHTSLSPNHGMPANTVRQGPTRITGGTIYKDILKKQERTTENRSSFIAQVSGCTAYDALVS